MTINPLSNKLSSNVLEASALTTSSIAFFLELGFLPVFAPIWLYLSLDFLKRFHKQPKPQTIESDQDISPTPTVATAKPATVGIFVDHSNLEYAAKCLNFKIDYQALLTFLQEERPLAGAWFYTKINPNRKGKQAFCKALESKGYEVKQQRIDHANAHTPNHQLAIDLEKFANQFEIAIVISNDEQFTPAVQNLKKQGKRVELIGHRTPSNDQLIEAVDRFTSLLEIKDKIVRN